jgi:hypothetical protein
MATTRKPVAAKKAPATKRSNGRVTPKGTPAATTRRRPADRVPPKQGVTSAKNWKSSARTPVELELPSGNVCLALNKGMKAFLDDGVVPNSLIPIVQQAITGAETGKSPAEMMASAGSEETVLLDMLVMMDGVLVACVKQPPIAAAPVAVVPDPDAEEEGATKTVVVQWGDSITQADGQVIERDEEVLYVDDVELEDKMFIFQWAVGGTDDVEQFRSEFTSTLEGLSGS